MKPPIFQNSWSEEVQAIYQHDMQEMWDPTINRHVWNQYHNQLDIYEGFASHPRMSVLDVGCAQGTLALRLAEAGHRVTAIDLRPQFLEYARSRHTHGEITFLELDILKGELPGKYDLVFANQIIEHLVYPVELCRRLMSALKPGGRLVMATPSWHYIKNKLPSFTELGDVSNWEHLQNSADGDGHFYAYTMSEFAHAMVSAGLHDVRVRPFETPAISGHMMVRHIHGIAPYALLKGVDRCLLAIPGVRTWLSHQLICTGVRPC